jgi:ribose-phosphate pyrophosphokinase
MTTSEILLFSGNSNPALAKKISEKLDISLGKALVGQFSDGETRIELHDNVRGRDVFIIQSTSAPTNHHIMEALIMIDACKRASAANITLVAPYFGYARQERKSAPRTPITAKLVAGLFENAGIHRLLSLELHNAAIQGFFNVPVDHLFANPIFAEFFKNQLDDLIVVSPDAGGVERSRALAKLFGCGLAIIDKRRVRPNESAISHIIGDVKGKNCLIVDDIVDTGGSLINAATALMEAGSTSVRAAITHAVLSGQAIAKIGGSSALTELIVTDSIPLSAEAQATNKIRQVSIARLMSEAIKRIHHHDSISSLFI